MSKSSPTATTTTTAIPSKKTFTGSCHCGFIKYEASIPMSESDPLVANRCNCTICLKQGFTGIKLDPADFHLLSPDSMAQVKDYQTKGKDIHKYFCGTCGVHIYQKGQYEYDGQVHEFFTLNAPTLDQPQEGLDLSQLKIQYWDGRNDNFRAGARDGPWPGGCV
jgi:hypothetical protein